MKTKLAVMALLIALLISCEIDPEKKATLLQEQSTVIELAPFSLKEGVTEETLLKISKAVQEEFIDKQPGFIKRELVRKNSREYLDIVYWSSQPHAEHAAQKAMETAVCLEFFSLMQQSEVAVPEAGLSYFTLIHTYE